MINQGIFLSLDSECRFHTDRQPLRYVETLKPVAR